ncbi:hypothetical protein DB32_001882 [Sandaracinus amylolyticus]|uniref:Peptidase metallopeptidase domain-containing protein n=1 Tax=Sandaracinus amylolyticus TaxID=927083 RepID=A0A0F6W1A2_9BACT|nr:hypothetical protein DB32_001882 [Sandaracinus amylolyticus]
MRTLVTLVAALAISVGAAGRARAYERATVTGDTTPLAWARRDLGLRIAEDTSRDLAPVDVRDAVRRSMTTWTRAGGCTDIVLVDLGTPPDLRTNLLGGAPDLENRVVFREDAWPSELGPETLAITTLVYRRSTGEILDADIDLNALDHSWSVAAVPSLETTDLENTITHEVGHLLGFAHVVDPDATMFASSDPGDVVKRDLATDDVTAVCEVYPASRRTPGGVGPRPPLTSGCAVSSAGGAGVIPVLLGLAALIVRRRRRS